MIITVINIMFLLLLIKSTMMISIYCHNDNKNNYNNANINKNNTNIINSNIVTKLWL